MNTYLIEDWLHFAETYSDFLFQDDVLDGHLRVMWTALQVVVRHYLRASDPGEHFTAARRHEAEEALLEYGRLLEAHDFPNKLCSYNLHICICRLARQESVRGMTGYNLELWVERLVHTFKAELAARGQSLPHP